MDAFSKGDILFIMLIFGVIHGITLTLGYVRRRKARRSCKTELE